MTPSMTRRRLLLLAGCSSLSAAMAGALRAEGGPVPALPFAMTTPIRIGTVTLKVRNLANMTGFYNQVLGLEVMRRDEDGATLGAGGVELVHLLSRPSAPIEPQFEAGLYHVAFLMPTRADLARWLIHVAYGQVPLTGFADHNVSEAVYLNDPEGNGIEVYSDRPREGWTWTRGTVTMGTAQLDVDDLVALTDTTQSTYDAAPEGLRIGHMHLKVGEVAAARDFYMGALGLDQTLGREDALFMSSGGYHHHVAANVWQSGGALRRNSLFTGLEGFTLHAESAAELERVAAAMGAAGIEVSRDGETLEAEDPWGTVVRVAVV